MKEHTTTDFKKLYRAVLSLKNRTECEAFFKDICTEQELASITQRIEVAELLREGGSYTEINKKTGASTATISRISRYLHKGQGGYKTVLERIKRKHD